MRRLAQRTEAVVSLSALKHNVRRIREIIGDGVEIMAVLKGDGYGHGEKKPDAPSRYCCSAIPATVSSKILSSIISRLPFFPMTRRKSSTCSRVGAALSVRFTSKSTPA